MFLLCLILVLLLSSQSTWELIQKSFSSVALDSEQLASEETAGSSAGEPNGILLNQDQELVDSSHELLLEYYAERRRGASFAEQRKILDEILHKHPENVTALLEMGHSFLSEKRSAEAFPFFEKASAVKKASKHPVHQAWIADASTEVEEQLSSEEKAAAEAAKREKQRVVRSENLLQKYYDAKKAKKPVAEQKAILEELVQLDPDGETGLLEMGYLLLGLNDFSGAEPYFQKVLDMKKHDGRIALQIGFIADITGDKGKARKFFQRAYEEGGEEEKIKAKHALEILDREEAAVAAAAKAAEEAEEAKRKQAKKEAPSRFFAELYENSVYYRRFKNWVFFGDAKFGYHLDCSRRWDLYLHARYVDDTASNAAIATTPLVFSDNLFLLAIGTRYRLLEKYYFYAYVDVGKAYDLIYRERGLRRDDLRAGSYFYTDWHCRPQRLLGTPLPYRRIGDLNFDVSYYSRYRYWIGYFIYREGAVLFDSCKAAVNGYAKLFVAADTKGEYYNNTVEVSPTLDIIPYKPFPLRISYSIVRGQYFRNVRTSPYGRVYWDQRVEITMGTYF